MKRLVLFLSMLTAASPSRLTGLVEGFTLVSKRFYRLQFVFYCRIKLKQFLSNRFLFSSHISERGKGCFTCFALGRVETPPKWLGMRDSFFKPLTHPVKSDFDIATISELRCVPVCIVLFFCCLAPGRPGFVGGSG